LQRTIDANAYASADQPAKCLVMVEENSQKAL